MHNQQATLMERETGPSKRSESFNADIRAACLAGLLASALVLGAWAAPSVLDGTSIGQGEQAPLRNRAAQPVRADAAPMLTVEFSS